MFMTNKKMMEEAMKIVKVNAPIILKELGLEENDGILDRITVTDSIGPTVPRGICNRDIEGDGIAFRNPRYVVGTAEIEINPLVYFYYMNKKNEYKEAPFFVRFFQSRLREFVLFTLAHELRHYWQYCTGEFHKNEVTSFGMNLIPYEYRWCEKDANSFARGFVKGVNK